MTGQPDDKVSGKPPNDELDPRLRDPHVLAWMDANIADLRSYVSDDRLLRTSLAFGFVAGLALHIGGYVLKSSAKAEPLGLIADLLYTLGFALWTGVVVVVFVQVLPEAKRREIKDVLDAYDAALRKKP